MASSRSYAAALVDVDPARVPSRSNMFPQRFHDAFAQGVETRFLKKASRKDGKPAIFLTEEEISILAAPCRLFLIGKFLYGNPKLELIRKEFEQMKLNGSWKIGKLDGRHILIQLTDDGDYTQVFARRTLRIDQGQREAMATVDFDHRTKPPIIPVWLRFPDLQVHLYDQELLFTFAKIYGTPLQRDPPT